MATNKQQVATFLIFSLLFLAVAVHAGKKDKENAKVFKAWGDAYQSCHADCLQLCAEDKPGIDCGNVCGEICLIRALKAGGKTGKEAKKHD